MTQPHETVGMVEGSARRERRNGAIRELFEIGPQKFGYVDECMRVLELNRQRPRGHMGRIFLARDLKTRRDIQRSRRSHS